MEHFASRRFGESIAALEEAQSLDSTDEEVLEALEFARQAETKYKQEQSLKLQERAMDAFTAREFDEAVGLLVSSPLLVLVPPFLGPGFRLGARWNRLGETVKTRTKREKTG